MSSKLECDLAQVVCKTIRVQELLDDVQCSEAFAEERLHRKHAWLELRAVARAMDGISPTGHAQPLAGQAVRHHACTTEAGDRAHISGLGRSVRRQHGASRPR